MKPHHENNLAESAWAILAGVQRGAVLCLHVVYRATAPTGPLKHRLDLHGINVSLGQDHTTGLRELYLPLEVARGAYLHGRGGFSLPSGIFQSVLTSGFRDKQGVAHLLFRRLFKLRNTCLGSHS